jgi:hypothetical protein
MVAKALVQLSAMLQIAFGEAGAHIIAHNITSENNINALVPARPKLLHLNPYKRDTFMGQPYYFWGGLDRWGRQIY